MEVHISPTTISVDSLERAPSALLALEGDARGASPEACALLEDGAPSEEPPLDDEIENEALPAEEAGCPPPRTSRHSFTLSGAQRTRPPDKLILGSYVKPLKWSRPSVNMLAPDQEAAHLLVRKCNPFDKQDSLVAHMCDLYLLSLRVPLVAHYEEYSIPFPSNLDKESY